MVNFLPTTGGCGQSFTSLIVSPEFVGKNSLKRHRLVNAALRDEIAQIHAWSAKCQTPDEWARRAPMPAAPPRGRPWTGPWIGRWSVSRNSYRGRPREIRCMS